MEQTDTATATTSPHLGDDQRGRASEAEAVRSGWQGPTWDTSRAAGL